MGDTSYKGTELKAAPSAYTGFGAAQGAHLSWKGDANLGREEELPTDDGDESSGLP